MKHLHTYEVAIIKGSKLIDVFTVQACSATSIKEHMKMLRHSTGDEVMIRELFG